MNRSANWKSETASIGIANEYLMFALCGVLWYGIVIHCVEQVTSHPYQKCASCTSMRVHCSVCDTFVNRKKNSMEMVNSSLMYYTFNLRAFAIARRA